MDAISTAVSSSKLIHILVLWGALDDQSCWGSGRTLREGPLECLPILTLLDSNFISSWALVAELKVSDLYLEPEREMETQWLIMSLWVYIHVQYCTMWCPHPLIRCLTAMYVSNLLSLNNLKRTKPFCQKMLIWHCDSAMNNNFFFYVGCNE